MALKRELFSKVGGFDEQFQSMVDLEMWVRMAGITKIEYVKDILVYVRKSNEDRISLNMQRKLNGSLLFWQKNRALINGNPRLQHRAASRVFLFAVLGKNMKHIFKTFIWTFAGLFFDFNNFIWIFRTIFATYYHKNLSHHFK